MKYVIYSPQRGFFQQMIEKEAYFCKKVKEATKYTDIDDAMYRQKKLHNEHGMFGLKVTAV